MTQAGEIPVSWSSIIGGVVGCGVAAAALVGIYRLREWRREARRERAPQTEKILRPAGYFALGRALELWEEVQFAALQVIGASVVGGGMFGLLFPVAAGLVLGRFTLRQVLAAQNSHVFYSILLFGTGALLWAVREFVIAARLSDEARNWQFGLRGEQAVAEALGGQEVAAAGYVVFHDVPAEKGKKKWNVDHVAVGPGGVFVLETKARPRRKAKWDQKENEVIFDGKVLRFPWCYDDRAVVQVEYNVNWVRKFLGVYAPKDLLIHPVIVVPGWYVRGPIDYPVKVMNAKYLVGYVKDAKALYTREELKTVIQRLDDACRSLEF